MENNRQVPPVYPNSKLQNNRPKLENFDIERKKPDSDEFNSILQVEQEKLKEQERQEQLRQLEQQKKSYLDFIMKKFESEQITRKR